MVYIDISTGAAGFTKSWNITISQTNFSHNSASLNIDTQAWEDVSVVFKEGIFYNNPCDIFLSLTSYYGVIDLSILDSVFYTYVDNNSILNSISIGLESDFLNGKITLTINNTNFTCMENIYDPIINVICGTSPFCVLSFNHLYITNSKLFNVVDDNNVPAILSIISRSSETDVTLNEVNMISNACYAYTGSTLYIESSGETQIIFNRCNFSNNTSVRGAAAFINLHFDQNSEELRDFNYFIENSVFA